MILTLEQKKLAILEIIALRITQDFRGTNAYIIKGDIDELKLDREDCLALLEKLKNEGFLAEIDFGDAYLNPYLSKPEFENIIFADETLGLPSGPMRAIFIVTTSNNFNELYKQKLKGEKINLSDKKIEFNDDKALIKINNQSVPLPPHKNGHFFCRTMYRYKVQEPIDWSIIYQEMTGNEEPKNPEKDKRMVQDTMYAINNRIKEIINTEDNLFSWENRSIKRNY